MVPYTAPRPNIAPSTSLTQLTRHVDRCKSHCTLRSETFSFTRGLSPFAGASSTTGTAGISLQMRPGAQPVAVGDVAGRLVQHARRGTAHACPARVRW